MGLPLLSKPEYVEDETVTLEAEADELSDMELAQFSALLAEALTFPAPIIGLHG